MCQKGRLIPLGVNLKKLRWSKTFFASTKLIVDSRSFFGIVIERFAPAR